METEMLPSWMTEDLLKYALKDGKESAELIITKWQAESAVPKGNNYSGIILRANVDYKVNDELKNVSLILKAMNIECFDEFAKLLGVTKKEFKILREYLVKVYELFQDNIGPKSYLCPNEDILIMEDLKQEGYEMADRRKQLDFDHTTSALVSLAKFHAASVRIKEIDPDFIESVSKEVLYSDLEFSEGIVTTFFSMGAKQILTWPECEVYKESIQEIGVNIYNKLKSIVLPKEGEFNVLNHGDCWTTNMMFKYKDGKPVHTKLIDFQVCRYGSPAIDIIHLVTCSVQQHVRVDRMNELIDVYLDTLNSHLEISGSSARLEKDALKKSIDERLLYSLNMCISALPVILADPNEINEFKDHSMDEICSDDKNPFLGNFKSALYREVCSKMLPEFEKKGLLKRNTARE